MHQNLIYLYEVSKLDFAIKLNCMAHHVMFFEVVVQTQIHCLTNAGVYLRTRNEERDKLVELRTYTSFFQPNLKRVASDVRKNVLY